MTQKLTIDFCLRFEIDSSILAEALNVNSGNDNNVILYPRESDMIIANLEGDYALYKLISDDSFPSYNYNKPISEDMISTPENIEYFIFDKTSLVQLLNKINGTVRITIDSDRSAVRKLYVEDVDGIDVKFSGHITLSDQTISNNRATALFTQHFNDNEIFIPKLFLAKREFHIFRLRSGVEFNPLIVNSKGNDQIKMSMALLNKETAELRIENKTLDSSFASNFSYLLYQSTDIEKLYRKAKSHNSGALLNGYNPKVIQNIIRFASVNYNYITVLETREDNYFVFSGKQDFGEVGTIYTTVNPFLEVLSDTLDISDINIEILEA